MAISEIDLSNASAAELEAHLQKIGGLIEQKKAEELEAKLKQVDELATSLGLARADLAAHFRGGKKRKSGSVAAKYRNPKDPSQTWAGRGRKPKWVEDHLSGGGKLEDLTIAA